MSPLVFCDGCGRAVPSKPCPDCKRAKTRARNARPAARAHRTPQHAAVRAAVLARDGGCVDRELGGCSGDLTCDYVVPLAAGGAMSVDNAVCRCRSHNSRRGGQLAGGGRALA